MAHNPAMSGLLSYRGLTVLWPTLSIWSSRSRSQIHQSHSPINHNPSFTLNQWQASLLSSFRIFFLLCCFAPTLSLIPSSTSWRFHTCTSVHPWLANSFSCPSAQKSPFSWPWRSAPSTPTSFATAEWLDHYSRPKCLSWPHFLLTIIFEHLCCC